MQTGLTARTFSDLLVRLDTNEARAAEAYEELRRKLLRFFEWRSAPFPDEYADEVLNRLAKRIAEGVAVKDVGSYCYEIARFVLLEAFKSTDSGRVSLEDIKIEIAASPDLDEGETQIRLGCLDDCLRGLPKDGRTLIVGYYQDEGGDRIGHRKALADRLGLNREALANRAQRLRDKLERCVTRCAAKKVAI